MNQYSVDKHVARSSALCWGQRHLWLRHSDLPVGSQCEYNLDLRLQPPRGATTASLRAVLDLLVRRYDGLRTTFGYADGSAVQRVRRPGDFTSEVVEVDGLPGESEDVPREFVAAPFDLAEDPPMRALVLTRSGRPILLVIVLHHTAVDDWAINRLHHEFMIAHEAIAGRKPVALPAVHTHPVDLAQYEASDEAQLANQRAVAHWSDFFRGIPGDVFTVRHALVPDEPVASSASLTSAGASDAVRRLAGRYRVWPAVIHAAAFSALLAAFTGNDDIFYLTYDANRGTRLRAEVMSNESQPIPLRVPGLAADVPFAEVVKGTLHSADEAKMHSPCAYDEVLELAAVRSGQRGVALRLGVYFNYLNYAPAAHESGGDGLTWNEVPGGWAVQQDDVYFRVHQYRDGIDIALNALSAVMKRPDVERFVRGHENLLVTQAGSADELTIAGITELAGFQNNGPTPMDLVADATARCLAEHPAVSVARVFPDEDGGLHANLAVSDPQLTPAVLRTHVLENLYERPHLRCPDTFTVYTDTPVDSDDPAAWQRMPELRRGAGTDPRALPPVTEAELALFDAVTAANGLPDLSMAQSYVSAGGRAMNVPLLQNRLRQNGWTGARLPLLVSAAPLRLVATRMTRLTG